MMRYKCTRPSEEGELEYTFVDVVLQGLHKNGGLFVPTYIPKVSPEEVELFKTMKFRQLAYEIIRKFVDETEIPSKDLRLIVDKSFDVFRISEVVKLQPLDDMYLLELFHGPTYAFKDVPLQFLGTLFDYILTKQNRKMLVLGATSGDTGSAAIAGMAGRDNIKCVILFPVGRTSKIQQLQMTTCLDENVECIGVNGTFDECQSLVKKAFVSPLRSELNLGAVNSINWARILIQTSYYWYAAFRVLELKPDCTEVDFCVPTGNFGNILAGYYAKLMGAPISHLIIATNSNNILVRCHTDGEYKPAPVLSTLSPSMDIQISSNFERFLYYLGSGSSIDSRIDRLGNGGFALEHSELLRFRKAMLAFSAAEEETAAGISETYQDSNILLDPHTAVGVVVARKFQSLAGPEVASCPMICLATAHYSKFYDSLIPIVGERPVFKGFPEQLKKLECLETHYTPMNNDADELFAHLRTRYAGDLQVSN